MGRCRDGTCGCTSDKCGCRKVVNNYCKHLGPECRCSENKRLAIMNEEKSNHDHTAFLSSQPLSSGRWDAAGSWNDAVTAEMDKAFSWASNLDLKTLHWAVTVMASDVNAFSLYERKAILEVIALKLGAEVRGE